MMTEKQSEKGKELTEEELQAQADADERGAWGSQLEFILTCVGYAVGLGNVWRFPYLCFKNGGGAFLIPYVIMLAFVGLPIFFFELCFGQFASLGPISIWTINPLLKGIGYGMVAVSWMIGLYYNIVICYAFYYFFASMTSVLPWSECQEGWSDYKCMETEQVKLLRENETLLNQTLEERNLTSYREFESPSSQFFYNEVLKMSDGLDDLGTPVWQLALCLLLCWTIVFLVLIRGIQSLGKVVYVVAIFPYIMMTILLIRGATLEGASLGIEFYLKPNMTKLQEAEVWSDAATQIFFSLSACSGGLIAMASYNNFNNNCFRDSLIVPLINCGTSIYAGFAIFSVLGFIATEKGVEVADVADGGPGLVFVVYPEALTQMPVPTLWAILFFLMLIMLGFSSEFSIVEAVFAAIIDEYAHFLRRGYRPVIFRGVCCAIFYLITLPMVCNGGFYLFTLVDDATGGFPLLFVGFFEITSIIWIYGFQRFSEDVALMIGKKPNIYFRVCWSVLTPLFLLVIIILKAVQYNPLSLGDYDYPDWSQGLTWSIVAFTVMWIPVIFIGRTLMYGAWEVIKKSSQPTEAWGPAQPKHRAGTKYDKKFRQSQQEANGVFSVSEGVEMNGQDNPGFMDEKL